ncbi:hypothetical protein EG329_004697 [Mollisiaceae sp. DMI_Dod_QoI]|nr:hypothetical protein EG329_004697 [Helotiales sp. DMI_Dod_QoI]
MVSLITLSLLFATAFSLPHPEPETPPTIEKQPHRLDLQRISSVGKTSSRLLWQSMRTGLGNISSADLGQDFLANVTFGNETRIAIIDTGSSDTWLVESGFTCVDYTTNYTIPPDECHFGPAVPRSKTFTPLPDSNFNISYADGEYLNGHVGYDTVSFAGITIQRQEISLAYLAGWFGDSYSSGLLGLAFPAVTSVYAGDDPKKDIAASTRHPDVNSTQKPYSSLMNTMFFVENITSPLFSLALSRDGAGQITGYGGVLEIGGILDRNEKGINASADFVSTGIQILSKQWINPKQPAYQFYTITVDSFAYRNARTLVARQYIVDSGTTLLYLPSTEAAAINALFVPPAYNDGGQYMVQCNAIPPSIGVKVNGTVLSVNPRDLIVKMNERGTSCASGVQDGGTGPFVLGDVFLVNVLAVFDLGSYEMKFATRQYYV